MKNVVWMVGLGVLGGLLLAGDVQADPPFTITLTRIQFNYDTGSNGTDGVTIQTNEADVTAPEWITGSKNEPVAYVQGSNKTIRARFTCTSNDSLVVYIEAEKTAGDMLGDIDQQQVTFKDGVSSPEYRDFTVTNVPGSVEKGTVTWQWYFRLSPPGDRHNVTISGAHTVYVVLSSPQAPMTKPWTEVLDYSCDWADGQSSSSAALCSLTTKLYCDSGLDYDGGQSHYNYDQWPNTTKWIFDLTDFLSDWDVADCQDCGMFLSVLSSSIGASLTHTRRIQGYFTTKSILPIGPDNTWGSTGWSFHHIGWLSNVYDPCIKLDQADPRIPIDEDIDNPYKTDLWNSGPWSPQDAFRLGQTDPYHDKPTEIQ